MVDGLATHPLSTMFELLYSTDAASKTFPLSGLSVLSTVLEWCMASWSPLHTVNDMGCDKTLNTALKSAHFVPGAYIDETLLRVTSCLRSPSVPKISSPGPGTPVMPCTEICESPVQDGSCASLVKGSPEDQQYDDIPGYISDESVCFAAAKFQDTDVLIVFVNLPGPRYDIRG